MRHCCPLLNRWVSSMKRIALPLAAGGLDHVADILNAGADGAEGEEGQARFSRAIDGRRCVVFPVPGRTPEDHRRSRCFCRETRRMLCRPGGGGPARPGRPAY
ncbi:MAG: hypothetical protein MZV64_01730 [Ignavibacteriales bacterium]|nr:hypothetical protein [Ignavibacteriales bacterium]